MWGSTHSSVGCLSFVNATTQEKRAEVRQPFVLFVDDERELREIVCEFLTERQFEVMASGGVDEALQAIQARTPDLLITDLRMPRRSGVELLEELVGIAPALPVIVCSGLQHIKQEVLFFHGSRPLIFHDKPMDLERLINDIRSILGGLC